MPRLADGFVNELKGRIDLYDVISPYVQLKKSGSSWVGLSPFSQEKHPHFMSIRTKVSLSALVLEKAEMQFLLFRKLKIWNLRRHLNSLLRDLAFH